MTMPTTPTSTNPASDANHAPLLEVNHLSKFFPIRKGFLRNVVGHVRAVDDVSFSIRKGETLSLVGRKRLWQDHDLALHPACAQSHRG